VVSLQEYLSADENIKNVFLQPM